MSNLNELTRPALAELIVDCIVFDRITSDDGDEYGMGNDVWLEWLAENEPGHLSPLDIMDEALIAHAAACHIYGAGVFKDCHDRAEYWQRQGATHERVDLCPPCALKHENVQP